MISKSILLDKKDSDHLRNNKCNDSKIPFEEKCPSGWEFLTKDGWMSDQTLLLRHLGK